MKRKPWAVRFYRTRWGGVVLFPYRRFLWGLEANLLTDSWDVYLCPFMIRIEMEALERVAYRLRIRRGKR